MALVLPARRSRLVVGLLIGVVVALVIAGALTALSAPGRQSARAAVLSAPPSAPSAPQVGLQSHSPVTAVAPGTPVQQEYDQAFASGLGGEPGMAAATALRPPAPQVSGGWPVLPVATTPEAWATVFTQGLLDLDFARVGRAGFGPWLMAQEAPELLAGIPASVADKVLYISVLDSGLFGGQPTPVPSPARWTSLAGDGVRQRVSGLLVQPDPTWAQMVGAGWQPADVRMTEVDVTGLLTVSGPGRAAVVHRFGLQVIVGSARWHDGYGTVAVAGWRES